MKEKKKKKKDSELQKIRKNKLLKYYNTIKVFFLKIL